MTSKIDLFIASYFLIAPSSVLTLIGSVLIIIYQLSMLRKNIIQPDFNGKWFDFFKSWFKTK